MSDPSLRTDALTPRGAERIQSLVATAGVLFLERGYDTLSLDEIIARVGGSRRTIYQRFGGKEGLFVEAIERLCEELAEPIRHLDPGIGSGADALRSYAHALLLIVTEPRALALHRLMVAEGERFPRLAQAIYNAGHRSAAMGLADHLETWRQRETAWQTSIPSLQLAESFVALLVSEVQLRALIGLEPTPLLLDQRTRIVETASAYLLAVLNQSEVPHA